MEGSLRAQPDRARSVLSRSVGRRLARGVSALLAAAVGLMATTGAAIALIEIDVTRGSVQPLPIAVPSFVGTGPDAQLGVEMAKVISTDLLRSGIFAPIDPSTFSQPRIGPSDAPRFADWRVLSAQALVAGGIAHEADGRLRVDFRLWDVFAGQQMTGQRLFTQPENWRRVAHLVADAIYERLTGERGYFDFPHCLRGRDRPQGPAHQAACHYGSGWSQCALPDHRRRPCADTAIQPVEPGDHLYVLRRANAEGSPAQHRDRAAGTGRRIPGQ